MPNPDPPPHPSSYRGYDLRRYLEMLINWLMRDRPVFGPEFTEVRGPGGRRVTIAGGTAASSGSPLIKLVTSSSITSATWDGSGNITPGTGSAVRLEWDGGAGEWTPTGATETINNPYRGTVPISRLIWCTAIADGPDDLELVAAECGEGDVSAFASLVTQGL